MIIYPIIPHDDLAGFVANEHIDWTAASDNLVTTGSINSGYVGTTNNKLSARTTSGAPIQVSAAVEIISDVSNVFSTDCGLEVDFFADVTSLPLNSLAGVFFQKSAGTLGTNAAGLSALFGGCQTDVDITDKSAAFYGLQFNCLNLGDITETFLPKSVDTYGIKIEADLGGGTISNTINAKNYGVHSTADIDGTFNADVTGYNYGVYAKTTDSVDDGSGDIISYGFYIDACADNADFGSGGTLTSYGLYEVNGRDNVLAGNTRIGSTTAPAVALDVTGDGDFSGVIKVDGTQVVKEQQAHVADATTQDIAGADTVDETKLESDLAGIVSTINSILSTLETHGLVAGA